MQWKYIILKYIILYYIKYYTGVEKWLSSCMHVCSFKGPEFKSQQPCQIAPNYVSLPALRGTHVSGISGTSTQVKIPPHRQIHKIK